MKKSAALSALTGVLLALSFPPVCAWPLAWVAFVPLFFALSGAGPKKGFVLGYAAGFVYFLGTVYWVVHSMFFYGGLPFAIGTGVMLLLVAYLAIYPALFAAALVFSTGAKGRLNPVKAAVLFTALEFLRGYLFTGFPWSTLGYTQATLTTLVQFVDITGVWGLTFLVVFVNAALYRAAAAFLRGERPPVAWLACALVLLTTAIAYGSMMTRSVDSMVLGWPSVKAAVVQGNIDQSLKWDKAFAFETLKIYRDLTMKAAEDGAGLVVWPETAVPYFLGRSPVNDQYVSETVEMSGAYVLTGSPSYDYDADTHIISQFNSAYLVSPEGEVTGRYDKVHLVPFGEYVPLKRFLPFVKKLTAGVGDFAPGPGPVPLSFDAGGLGVVICYEAIFGELARGAVKNGAGVLVNITNDAWFGRTSAPYQHFEMSLLRAVENRVFLLRAANTGISAIVDPAGRVRARTELFTRAVAAEEISVKKGPLTFYTRYGDVFACACIVVAALFLILPTITQRRSTDV